LNAGVDRDELAISLADVLVKESTLTKKAYLASSPYFKSLIVGGYKHYFKKKNMV